MNFERWTEPLAEPAIEAGVIGWAGDDDVAEVGDEENDGNTLIKVQLVRGGVATDDPKPEEASGPKILCRMSGWPFWAIPPKGLQCYVMFPAGFSNAVGAGVIAALPGVNPFVQFSGTRAKLDVGEDQDLVLKGRSITLSTYENDFIAVGPDSGILISDRSGNLICLKDGVITMVISDDDPPDAKIVLQLSLEDVRLLSKSGGSAGLKIKDGKFTVIGAEVSLVSGSVMLGAKASPMNAAMVALPGSAMGVGSTSVFISP